MEELRQALKFAVEKEEEAEAFYRNWAERAENPGVTTLFTQLASWEQGHVEKLSRVSPEELIGTGDTPTNMNISELMVSVQATQDMSLQEAFVVAMKREEASAALYSGMATLGGAAGELFAGLEKEERRHKQLLEDEYEVVFLTDN
ncbi:MAG: ferritin family protein [Candidatus Bipolaricaulota bacterium]